MNSMYARRNAIESGNVSALPSALTVAILRTHEPTVCLRFTKGTTKYAASAAMPRRIRKIDTQSEDTQYPRSKCRTGTTLCVLLLQKQRNQCSDTAIDEKRKPEIY